MKKSVTLHYTALTNPGMIRENNEDYYLLGQDGEVFVPGSEPEILHTSFDYQDKRVLLVLCDGLGGCNAGEVASREAAERIFSGINNAPEQPLWEIIRRVNWEIHHLANKKPDLRGMGTTLVTALFSSQAVDVYTLGDSRAYRLRKSSFEQLTEDQSLVWSLYKQGKLSKEELRFHPQNNIVTHALGIEPELLPQELNVFKDTLKDGDLFLLCSDGLTDLVAEEEILTLIKPAARGELDLKQAALNLVNSALREGGRDNITVILASVSKGGD